MILYPAIDLRGGKCVRLSQGRYDDMTVFSDDPVKVALKFRDDGAKYIHVVDLDGARGDGSNRELIRQIAGILDIPVQSGGGIRTMDDIDTMLSMGIARVIIGTSAVRNPDLVADAVKKYGSRIAVGIDAKDGLAAIEGWEKVSSLKAVEFAKSMEAIGVKTVIYTDISTDGMLKGPNLSAMKEMISGVGMDIIASGGVSSLKDIIDLKNIGIHGAIIGKALYSGAVSLRDALKISSEV
jgi:phosphoribosylformimino-5-aminoimidazole carboxamide ribotide isomerase